MNIIFTWHFCIFTALIACIQFGSGQALGETLPAPFNWKNYKGENSKIYVLEHETYGAKSRRFSLALHTRIHELSDLVDKEGGLTNCSKELNKAAYYQDIAGLFSARAHFDECNFTEGMDDLNKHWREAGKAVQSVSKYELEGRFDLANEAVIDAVIALGRALHAIQDFYAHTNYLEIQRDKGVAYAQIETLPMWRVAGRDSVNRLVATERLISGTVIYQFFQNQCPAGTPSHDELNKDSEDSAPSISRWDGRNLHRAAYDLAITASGEFLSEAFAKWPLLKRYCRYGIIYGGPQDIRKSVPK